MLKVTIQKTHLNCIKQNALVEYGAANHLTTHKQMLWETCSKRAILGNQRSSLLM